MSFITQIADRLHVSASDRSVIRAVRSRIKKKDRRDPAKRWDRRLAYRIALKRHAENRSMYAYVTGTIH